MRTVDRSEQVGMDPVDPSVECAKLVRTREHHCRFLRFSSVYYTDCYVWSQSLYSVEAAPKLVPSEQIGGRCVFVGDIRERIQTFLNKPILRKIAVEQFESTYWPKAFDTDGCMTSIENMTNLMTRVSQGMPIDFIDKRWVLKLNVQHEIKQWPAADVHCAVHFFIKCFRHDCNGSDVRMVLFDKKLFDTVPINTVSIIRVQRDRGVNFNQTRRILVTR